MSDSPEAKSEARSHLLRSQILELSELDVGGIGRQNWGLAASFKIIEAVR